MSRGHVALDIADIIDNVLLGAIARVLRVRVDGRVILAREHSGVAVRVPVRSYEHDRLVRMAQLVEGYDHAFEDAAILGGVVERPAVGHTQPYTNPMQAIADDAALAAHGLEASIGDVRAAGRQRFSFAALYDHTYNQMLGTATTSTETTPGYGGVNASW